MIKNFVSKPLFTLSLYVIFLILGFFSLGQLPLDFLPNIAIPSLTIITPYPGASAEDIETTVSKVIEDAVATVPNIDKISSNSQENISTVTISFKWGSDIDASSADVRDKLDLVRSKLPRDVQPPTLFKFDLSQVPVLVMGISADNSYKELYHIADKRISLALKKIKGVGTINIFGGLERQINIEVNRFRLEAYHFSMDQVNQSLAMANLSMPAGSIKSGTLDYGIRIPGEFESTGQIEKIIIGSYNGRDIYLGDIATVKDDFKETTNMTEVNGVPGLMIQVQKQSGANSVKVVEEVKTTLKGLLPQLPNDLKLTYIQDTAESIIRQVTELRNTLMWSFLFIVLTVFFFLRNVRGSLIVSLAMPFSIIAAFIFMNLAGATINIISLASIIISIGIVVDDAIVVLENVYRHRDKKNEPPKEAAIYGAGEVFGAVLASTTTNIVIFIPLLLVSGFIGIFFSQLASISIAIIAMSLVVAITLTPMLCSKLLDVRKREGGRKSVVGHIFDRSEAAFTAIENAYKQILGYAVNNRRQVIIICALIFIASLPVFIFTGSEFFPNQDSGFITATLQMPSGTRWDQTGKTMRLIEARAKKEIPEMTFIMVTAGTSSQTSFLGNDNGPNFGKIYLRLVPLDKRQRGQKEIERVVANIAYAIPGVKTIKFSSSGANAMSGSGKPISIEIYGPDFGLIDPVAEELKEKISRVPGVVDATISREKTNPEYSFKVDRMKAAGLGLSVYDVAMAARSYIYGTTATKYREAGDEYDIFTRLRESDRQSLEDLQSVTVTTRAGKNIALSNIADIQLKSGPQMIERKNQQRVVYVEGDYFGRSLGDIVTDIKHLIAKTSFPQEITVTIAGNAQQMQESFRSLFIALIMGMALIYLVMVAQFESFLDPFIIMFAIPFALVGVIWALFLTGYPFGVMAFIGIILVTGVAVKNSIVLVDYINILRARGVELKDAVQEAGRIRLRPIMMTSSTAILGLMPIIMSSGESSGFWKSMAISVVGGLLVSATVSLIFVPTLYYVIESRYGREKG